MNIQNIWSAITNRCHQVVILKKKKKTHCCSFKGLWHVKKLQCFAMQTVFHFQNSVFYCLNCLSLQIISPLRKIRHWTACFLLLKVVEVQMNCSFTLQSYVYWTRDIALLLWLLRTFWKRSSGMWQEIYYFYISIQSQAKDDIYLTIYVGVKKVKVSEQCIPFFITWVPAWDGKVRRNISFILTIIHIYKKWN